VKQRSLQNYFFASPVIQHILNNTRSNNGLLGKEQHCTDFRYLHFSVTWAAPQSW